MKKIISLALCLALVFSTFACLGSFTISAVGTETAGYRYLEYGITYWYSSTGTTGYTSGTGTADDPYIITTAAQLRHLARGDANGAGKYYKLGNDIVINDSTNKYWYEESGLQNWIKGTDANGAAVSDTMNGREMGEFLFRGNFDGAGHTISGLYINYNGIGTMNASGTGYKRIYCGWGLFPYVYGATFKNVKLKDVYIKSNVTGNKNAEYHGYGALVGNVHGGDVATTFENVQVENVHFDIARPNLSTTGKPVGVGGIIGYSTGNLTVKDAIVKNVTASFRNYYATSRCVGYAGAIFGAIGWGKTANLTNVLTFGAMNPVSVVSMTSGGAVYIASGNATGNLQANLSPVFNTTNCYSIGAEQALSNSNIIKVADEQAFISDNLDTFYANVGSSTNWADKEANNIPTLKSFPETLTSVLKCNFSNYTTIDVYANSPNANTNWTVLTDETDGNKYLQGDFGTVTSAQDFAFTLTPNAALGNGSNLTGYYGWGESGVMVPGTVYKLDFKAKAENAVSMSYAIYNGYSYGAGYNNREDHITDGVYDASGSRIADLTTDWQEYSMYFTAESYPNNNGQGTNRPIFQIQPNTSVYGNKIYFDDVVMTPVNAVSFKEYDNHYSQPCVGEIGATITVPATEPKRDGYNFDGWFIDEDCTIALDTENTKIGDITVAYAKWAEAAETILSLDFSNYINGSSNTNTNWVVGSEGTNNYLKGTTNASTTTAGFGFTLVDNSKQKYDWGVNGPIEPGKTYMISFKAKAKNNCEIDYAIYNGYSYAKNSGEKHRYYDSNNILCYEETGNLAKLTGEWATFTAYFTSDEYIDPDNGGVNRPIFYMTNRDNEIWDNEFYFDDFEITPCENYVSFNLYNGKYAKPFVADSGTEIIAVSPERKDYIFEGWYQDAEFANAFTATTVSGEAVAYAKWSEAVTELNIASIAAGTTDLGIKVTNANVYPVKFTLDTENEVTISIFTASAENAYDKSIVWERTFERSGDIGTLIEPAVINGGNKLYISVDGSTASISEFVIGGEGVPTTRNVEGDVNGDNKFDVLDLVRLKKMSVGTSTVTWLGDLDEDGFVAEATDLIVIRKGLLGISSVVTTMGDRTLVWNDEFDGNGVNYSNFSYSNLEGANKFNTDSEENINVNDGKLNLSVSNFDGTTFKVPCRLITQDKVAFNRGYLEVRAKISATPGQWAGIWLSGEKGAGHFGEIDIMETDILGTSFKPNIHSWDTEGKRLGQLGNTVALYDYSDNDFNKTEYHIFGFEWDETELKFYVDGECYETLNISDVEKSEFPGETLFQKSYPFEGIFDQFYCVKFDNNIYDNLSADGVMPEFVIDYVRLYQKDGEQLKINGELVEK